MQREEIYNEVLDYFNGNKMQADIWINKYCLKDHKGNFYERTPDDMHRRIAKELARIELKYPNSLSEDFIYDMLKRFSYIIPQGSPMAGIGNDLQTVSLGNCFVVGHEKNNDSYSGILDIEHSMISLMKRRGGVGIDVSFIRPTGSPVNNAAITSTGVVPFMARYSNGTREVAQDGRRGALMLTIDIKHPDVENFIDAKLDLKKVTGANISVKISDEFMMSVRDNKEFKQQYPIDSDDPIVEKIISPKKLWAKLVNNTWKAADPGILFWDKIISESPADCYRDYGFKTTSTNPCGELPLSAYDSCRLLCVNLFSFVQNPFTNFATFDYDLFSKVVVVAQRLMDDIIDLEEEKINKILDKIINEDKEDDFIKKREIDLWFSVKKSLLNGRRTGLGVVALADMLAGMGLKYGTQEATNQAVLVHRVLAKNALKSSVILAKERGAFPIWNYELEKDNPFLNRIMGDCNGELLDMYRTHGRRNISMLTVAPTGTVSLMADVSSGIEPVFNHYFIRRRKINPNDKNVTICYVDENGDAWENYNIIHPKLAFWAEVNNHGPLDKLSREELDELIKLSPYYGATANEINALEKVKMQGAIQRFVDHSISVTHNLPEKATVEQVEELMMSSWVNGCKGVTIYRDKCRSGVLINEETKDDPKSLKNINIFKENHAPKRPKVLPCEIMRFSVKGDKWIGVLGLFENKPYEIFTGPIEELKIPNYITHGNIVKERDLNGESLYNLSYVDKEGTTVVYEGLSKAFNKNYWNYGRLISSVLRHGMPILNVVQIIGKLDIDNESLTSWKMGVQRMLKNYIQDGAKIHGKKCPECLSTELVYKEGCITCSNCGWSKCG